MPADSTGRCLRTRKRWASPRRHRPRKAASTNCWTCLAHGSISRSGSIAIRSRPRSSSRCGSADMLEAKESRPDLASLRAGLCARMDSMFEALLPLPDAPHARLYEAIRHATIGGGKRLRPLLVLLSGRLFGVAEESALRAGLAVEAIHAHSLIHDDLPCMDDDDLRRGRPTVHCAFDEATAVLAGDSLLALAFELLADPETHPDAAIRGELVISLSRAAGAAGMAGGQMIDIISPAVTLD